MGFGFRFQILVGSVTMSVTTYHPHHHLVFLSRYYWAEGYSVTGFTLIIIITTIIIFFCQGISGQWWDGLSVALNIKDTDATCAEPAEPPAPSQHIKVFESCVLNQ